MSAPRNLIILAVISLAVFLGCLTSPAEEEQAETAERVLKVSELPEFRITKGEVLYVRFCAFCHGPTGAGDGLNAFSIPVKPRNFTDKASIAQRTDEELRRVIQYGGPALGLSTYMPPFGKTLSPGQIENLQTFIRDDLGKGLE